MQSSTRQAPSGILVGPEDKYALWWRHTSQRPADYIRDMTMDEIRLFIEEITQAADKLEADHE